MWPWGHLAVAYLALTALTWITRDRSPRDREALIVGGAALLPDLIDKPLAWTFQILPNGRSLGHSLVFSLILIGAVSWILRHRSLITSRMAFGVGILSHLFGDALYPVMAGKYYYTSFMFYPFVPAIEYPDESTSILAHFAQIEFTQLLNLEIGFSLVVLLIWVADGYPGLHWMRSKSLGDERPEYSRND